MAEATTTRLISTAEEFEDVVSALAEAGEYAVDTEFHRERTYYAQLALVQLGWDDTIVLVDPLAVDIAPLARVFEGQGLAIMHACRQDLEVLERHCGRLPERIVDTQLMAGFVGYVTPSLANLVERELGIKLPKGDRLTDWLRRPLTEAQQRYAASDVAHLVEIHDRLRRRLAERDRLGWFEQAMVEMLAESRGPRDPDEAWRRIKELRHLKGRDLGVARRVAAWRERRAAEIDVTPRFVLSDLAVVGVAVSRPTTAEELRAIRGVDGRALKPNVTAELLSEVADAVTNPPRSEPRAAQAELPAELRPALPLVSAWVTQVSRDLEIEAALLATRADLEEFLRGDESARLARGWRAEVVGTPIRRLLSGEVAIAFERSGGLVLEPRSGR